MFEVQLLHQDQGRLILPCRFEAFNLMSATSDASHWIEHEVSCDEDLGFIETGMDTDEVWGVCSVNSRPGANVTGRPLTF